MKKKLKTTRQDGLKGWGGGGGLFDDITFEVHTRHTTTS